MKKLILALMLSILILSFGTAYARLSANDPVPGQDVVIPIICQGELDSQNNPVFGGLNTLIAIAEMKDGSALSYPDTNYVVKAKMYVYNKESKLVYDSTRKWTKFDVVVDNCKDIVKGAPSNKRYMMREDMPLQSGGTIKLFTGYVVYEQTDASEITNRFIPWAYLVDLTKGFASGFNGVSAEDGLGNYFGEDGGNRPVTANQLFPRFFLLNDKDDTFNWWIILAGRNELGKINPIQYNVTRFLDGDICNEEELCRSVHIPIPYELNLIDVYGLLGDEIKTGCNFPANPCGGFGKLRVSEAGTMLMPTVQPLSIIGTANDGLPIVSDWPFYSLYGWSYQREAATSAALSWDVIHEIHRTYCSGPGTGSAQGAGISEDCTVTIGP